MSGKKGRSAEDAPAQYANATRSARREHCRINVSQTASRKELFAMFESFSFVILILPPEEQRVSRGLTITDST
jgi:hypothetical protein